MRREFKTSVNVGKPQVVYRETIEMAAESRAVFDKEVAGQRHYGEVALLLRPRARGAGNRFVNEIDSDTIPENFIPAIEAGVRESLESGMAMGYPVIDVETVLTGGGFKESLGSDLAFKVSASMACKEALAHGSSFLLDPIMDVEVFLPEPFMGEVIGDLNSRGGKIESIEPQVGVQVIKAVVPLARMFGYSTSLRSATQGRGTFSMQFSHFDRSK
jgi:elongation factor G